MAQPLKYENSEDIFFITSRTIGSRLWFVNNPGLMFAIVAYLAKYQKMYGVEIFGFVLMGNHYHLIARFPLRNKAAFMRSFNAIVAKLTNRHVAAQEGKLWGRRYSDQTLKGNDAVENWFFYAALNPIISGITEKLSEYLGYNSFSRAIIGVGERYKLLNESAYYEATRWNNNAKRKDFLEEYTLTFSRLPGYENLSPTEYQQLMKDRLEERRLEVVKERVGSGMGFASRHANKSIRPGAKPKSTKISTRYSFRPLVLTLCKKLREEFLQFYFTLKNAYAEASKSYLNGDLSVIFPQGTYAPPLLRC